MGYDINKVLSIINGNKRKLTYPSPGYDEKNWALPKYGSDLARALGYGYATLMDNGGHSNVSSDPYYYLANALVEGRKDFGNDATIGKNYNSAILGQKYAKLFAYKTGDYADRIYGEGADIPTRISLWNGVGVKKGYGGKIIANANNHARKVVNLAEMLKNDPRGQELVNEFKTYSNPEVWGYQVPEVKGSAGAIPITKSVGYKEPVQPPTFLGSLWDGVQKYLGI
jgi:hypothetical protein